MIDEYLFSPNMKPGIHRKMFNLYTSKLCSSWSGSPSGAFWTNPDILPCTAAEIVALVERFMPFPIKLIELRWTPIKVQKHLMANQWKQDAPELNFELHGKGCE